MRSIVKAVFLSCAVMTGILAASASGTAGLDNSKKLWGYMLHMTSNNWAERPYTDYPIDYHRDQSLRLKLHFDESAWNRIIDELVAIGANTLMIDVEDGMRYDSHPEIAVEGSWPKERMRAEVQRLKELGFTLIPKLNFSATHDTWLKGWQDRIGTPEYRKMCGELIDEVCDVFDRPKFFHIGTDEETAELKEKWGLKHCRSAEAWWTDVLAMIAAVERNGARACMWESTAMSRTEEFFRRCPRSVVITPTYYNYERIADVNSTHPTLLFIKRLTENGFDVLPGGSNWNCEENFRETVAWCERNVDRTHILGYLMLPWQVTLPAWHRTMQRAVNYLEDAMLQAGAKAPPEGKRQPFAAWVNRLSDGKLDRVIHPEDRRIVMETEEVVYDFGDTTGKQLTIDCMSFSKKDETITVCYGDRLDGSRIADPVLLGEFVLPAQALKDGYRVFKQGFVFPHGRYVSIRQTRQVHYTRLALVDPDSIRWVIPNLDQNHYQVVFGDDKMNVPSINAYVDRYFRGGHVTHVFVNPQCMSPLYPSKVTPPLWDGRPWYTNDVLAVDWVRRAKLLNDRGIDLYATLLGRVRARGAEGWISMRMNDIHCVDQEDSFMHSPLWHERRDLWRVPNDKSRSYPRRAFDFVHKEVRDDKIAQARELLDRYDADGFEADWTRFPWNLTPGRGKELAPCITEVMRAIRAKSREVARRRHHPVKVCATVLQTPDHALSLGCDVLGWVKEDLVDVVFVCNFWSAVNYDLPYREWCEKIHAINPNVRVAFRFDENLIPGPWGHYAGGCLQKDDLRGLLDNMLVQGCRDFGTFNCWEDSRHSGLFFEEDLDSRAVLGHRRFYHPGFIDAYDEVNPMPRPYPVTGKGPHELRVTVGTVSDAGRVYVQAGFDGPEGERVKLTLNGVEPIAVEPYPVCWINGSKGKVTHGVRCEFPVSALKAGSNAVGYPALDGVRGYGCKIEIEPKGMAGAR